MDDFGFGEDPFDVANFDDDCDVLNEIERDLGKSYIAERVNTTNNSLIGQTYTNNNNNNNNRINDDISFNIDNDQEKRIEAMHDDLFSDDNIDTPGNNNIINNNDNKPLKRSRKRKRSNSIDINNDNNGDDFLDLSILPNAKRIRKNQYISIIPEINNDDEIYLHSRPSLNDTSIMITNDIDNEKLYIYYDSYNKYNKDLKQCSKMFKKNTNNISLNNLGIFSENKSIDELLDIIENDRISKEIKQLHTNYIDDNNNNNNVNENKKNKIFSDTELWVDKYAPKKMIELLSSEKINREVTQWVKEWDYLVFGHKYSRNKLKKLQNKNINKRQNKNKNKNNKRNTYSIRNNIPVFGRKEKINNNNKSSIKSLKKRPEIPVLLFCGAPGTGKSTLAHIVANHCGYRPFEINASNDRSGKKLADIIINAATMKPMFGDTRPPLIIMDEIDGALNSNGDSKSAVDVILKLVKDANTYYNNKTNKKKRKNLKLVNRPIICICNNEYSRALRPLRDICKIYKFRPITTRILCKRLLDIGRKEYIHTDLKTLSYLCSITNNDIRSCLHTLQFFKEKSNSGQRLSTRLTINLLSSIPIGRKDKTQNIFDVWSKILKKTNNKNNNDQWKDICSMVYSFGGNNNKLIHGIIQNYLKLGYTDPMFDITYKAAEWIRYYDELKQIIDHKKQFTLMKYLPFMFIGIYEQCATHTFQKLEFPSIQYKNHLIQKENKNIIQQFLFNESDINNNIKQVNDDENNNFVFDICQYSTILAKYFNINSCVLELIPYIPYMIFTNKYWNNDDFDTMKNNNMYNKNKNNNRYNNNNNNRTYNGIKQVSNKRHFISIINTMIEYGLNYIKSDKSSNYLELKPPIHKLSIYSFMKEESKELVKYKTSNQYLKQKIAHQIVLEVMRRNEVGSNKYKNKGDIDNKDNSDNDNDNENRMMTPFMSNKKSQTKISKRYGLDTPSGNGHFGLHKRHDTPLKELSQTPSKYKNFIAAHNQKYKIKKFEYPVQYKFVAGYTNAVKRKSFCKDWI